MERKLSAFWPWKLKGQYHIPLMTRCKTIVPSIHFNFSSIPFNSI